MPIEIKELEIKVSLLPENMESESEKCQLEKEEIIEECIDRMLQILRDKKEL